jgi:hypothetical protein
MDIRFQKATEQIEINMFAINILRFISIISVYKSLFYLKPEYYSTLKQSPGGTHKACFPIVRTSVLQMACC